MTGSDADRSQSDRPSSMRWPFAAWPGGTFLISTLPPSATQRMLARALAVLLLAAFVVAAVFHNVELARYEPFVPIANTIVFLDDVLTAALLYVQFSMARHRALLVLASGFLFRGLMMVPHTLTFPGVFAPDGLLGASTQTASFLYITQYAAFLLSAVAYTLLRDRQDEVPSSNKAAIVPIVVATCVVVAGVSLMTWLLIVGDNMLPTIMADEITTTSGFQGVGSKLFLLECVLTIVVFRRRSTSMIDLWLKVAVWSWLLETVALIFIHSRVSLVFYVARTMGVVSSSFVLLAFFGESLMLHRRLIITLVAREQEREGHRTAIDIVVGTVAHELRQPLMAIQLNAQTGAMLSAKGSNANAEFAEVFDDIHASVGRSNEIIDSIRTMFAPSAGDRGPVDANVLVRDSVELVRLDLETHRVAVHVELSPNVSAIMGHRGQLLEVLLNGLKNAIESLATVADRERQIRIRTVPLNSQGVTISIEDSGSGLDPRARASAFDPFFSTKPRGMGLGLSICQTIVSAHGGVLSLVPGSPHGAVLRVELPGASE